MERTPLQQYLSNLCHAWAKGAAEPVAPPEGLDPAAVRAALLAHNVDVALGDLLPAAWRDDEFAARRAASRQRSGM